MFSILDLIFSVEQYCQYVAPPIEWVATAQWQVLDLVVRASLPSHRVKPLFALTEKTRCGSQDLYSEAPMFFNLSDHWETFFRYGNQSPMPR
eukprot:6485819-Amphidinium_carterae.1